MEARVTGKNTVLVKKPSEEKTPITIVMSIFITTLITACFSILLVHTYNMPASKGDLFFSSLLFSCVFTYVFTRKKKLWSILALSIIPALILIAVAADIFHLRQGLLSFISAIEKGTYRKLPIMRRSQLPFGRAALPFFVAFVNMIIALINTYVFTNRKHVIISFLTILPYLSLTLLVSYNPPGIILTVFTVYCIVIMLIYQNLRHASRKESETFILILTAPIIIFSLITCVAFPKKLGYDKLAKKGIHQVRHLIMDYTSPSSDFHKLAIKTLQQAEYGHRRDVYQPNSPILISFSSEGGETNLREVGELSQEKYPIGNFVLKRNPEYDGEILSRPRFIYLRNGTMDIYSENTWTASDDSTYVDYTKYSFEGTIDKREYFNVYKERSFEAPISPFLLKLEVEPSGYIPYYTDLYLADDLHTPYHDLLNVELGTHYDGGNLLEAKEGYLLPFATVPVKRGDLFSESYINDYVYGTCLTIPDGTKESLLDSGILPQWYIDILNGESDLTKEQQVKAITKYVSTIHPYDENTPYPPSDKDFVTWFMTESRTGFCVHYATTTVILLRMAGIPARYVTGFVAETQEFNWDATIYTTDAHAWFEFYHEEYGWILGDSTPDNGLSASFYDINGIEKAYNVEEPGNSTFTVDDYAYRDPEEEGDSEDLTPEEASQKEIMEIREVFEKILNISLIAIGSIAGLLVISRLAYFIYWKNKFSDKNRNKQARNYYHYYDLVIKAYKGETTERMLELAQIARFSGHELTDEEMNELIDTGEKTIEKYRKYLPVSKRFRGTILRINNP